ncbi:MAG: hypothetical protein OHK0017_07880 [Patescibacteria group bacterium]
MNLFKSHTIQLSTILITISVILSIPEVQAIIPVQYLPYVTAFVAAIAIVRKNNQQNKPSENLKK